MAIDLSPEEILRDYDLAWQSRHASLIGRKEVLTGKAKFGIFGDGKELPQLAMARAFEPGDIRSGYYRDQTFMFAAELLTLEQWFSQLYADPVFAHEPASSGRQMNGHFATPVLDDAGRRPNLAERRWSVADSSPTGSQMPRLVGLSYASKLFRDLPALAELEQLSHGGREVAFGTIGNASCAEGMFWEAVNALGVLGGPCVLAIWDDHYGISVPNELQVAKSDLSALLEGFQRTEEAPGGFELYRVKGWDYLALIRTFSVAAARTRRDHVPAIVHVIELTQPQGHSTSGSHERYKSPERLEWERRHDGLDHFRALILERGWADEEKLAQIESDAKEKARAAQQEAWRRFMDPIRAELQQLCSIIEAAIAADPETGPALADVIQKLRRLPSPLRRNLAASVRDALFLLRAAPPTLRQALIDFKDTLDVENRERYGSSLVSETARAAIKIKAVPAEFAADAAQLNGSEILNHNFEGLLADRPEVLAFGEDLGQLGDVNQGFIGLQEKFGKLRVADTGIRECTILGQAIGLAWRGLRPIAEIQYLDYLPYALQIISDDLATLRWRTKSRQAAPVIVRTRGHRLEGVWHSGSPMAGILNLVRGVYLCVPRDMTRAAGFYNTLLDSDDSAIVIEVLNGYRLKEPLPNNLRELRTPLGVPEILRQGSEVTVVTYGACCRIALAAAETLAEVGIEIEIIDVQTLLPFDRVGLIGRSLQKTNRILFFDEDVPGGATAFMMQQVLEAQGGYAWLDAPPRCLTAQEHRPAYGSDGDFWSKPQAEHLFEAVYELMHEAEPQRFPLFFR